LIPNTAGTCRATEVFDRVKPMMRESMNNSLWLEASDAPPLAFQPPRDCRHAV
jgi:hypothetical protein